MLLQRAYGPVICPRPFSTHSSAAETGDAGRLMTIWFQCFAALGPWMSVIVHANIDVVRPSKTPVRISPRRRMERFCWCRSRRYRLQTPDMPSPSFAYAQPHIQHRYWWYFTTDKSLLGAAADGWADEASRQSTWWSRGHCQTATTTRSMLGCWPIRAHVWLMLQRRGREEPLSSDFCSWRTGFSHHSTHSMQQAPCNTKAAG